MRLLDRLRRLPPPSLSDQERAASMVLYPSIRTLREQVREQRDADDERAGG